jgi:hypothetical protein
MMLNFPGNPLTAEEISPLEAGRLIALIDSEKPLS